MNIAKTIATISVTQVFSYQARLTAGIIDRKKSEDLGSNSGSLD